MKKINLKLCLILLISSISLTISAQKFTPCTLTLNGGKELQGFIKRYKGNISVSQGFKFYKDTKTNIPITAVGVHKLVVGDSIIYRGLPTRKGGRAIMKEILLSEPMSLYVYTYQVSGNMPGQGFSMWLNNEFYIKKGEEVTYVDRSVLNKKPETYFPDAPALCETIRNTPDRDFDLLSWVKSYNEVVSELEKHP